MKRQIRYLIALAVLFLVAVFMYLSGVRIKEKTQPVQDGMLVMVGDTVLAKHDTLSRPDLIGVVANLRMRSDDINMAWKRIAIESYKNGYLHGVIDAYGDSANVELSIERFKNEHKHLRLK